MEMEAKGATPALEPCLRVERRPSWRRPLPSRCLPSASAPCFKGANASASWSCSWPPSLCIAARREAHRRHSTAQEANNDSRSRVRE